MNVTKVVTAAALAVAAIGFAAPSQAAAHKAPPPSTHKLNFDDKYTKAATGNSCTPHWVLAASAPGDGNCNSVQAGAGGNGDLADNDYGSQGSSSVGFKIDSTRLLTGTVYIGDHPLVGTPAAQYAPGDIGADITITINGVGLGTVSKSGVVAPNGYLTIPISLRVPRMLNGKKVTSVDADVSFTDGVGLVGVLYAAPTQSALVIPSK